LSSNILIHFISTGDLHKEFQCNYSFYLFEYDADKEIIGKLAIKIYN